MNQQTDIPLFPPGHPDAPPAPLPEPPPGMAWGIAPSGERVLAYLPPATEQPAPASRQPDVWPKRLAAGGGATAAVIAAVGYAGPGLGEAGRAVEMAGVGVGVACASVGALVLLVRGSVGRQAQQQVNVSVNVSNGSSSTSSARTGRRR